MVAESQAEKLVISRTYAATPATVYAAWTTAEHMRQWLRPSVEFSHTLLEVNLKVGGTYRIGFKSPEGVIDVVAGEFLEIVPNERLAFSWTWEEPNEFAGIKTLVTVEFHAHASGTQLTLIQERFSEESMKERHMQGWTGSLNLLHGTVEQ